jgi:hypothetical protein
MPAKKAPTKAKKAAAKKPPAKVGGGIPPLPIACLNAAYAQYMKCLKSGVDPALCMKRLVKNAQDCFIRS